MRRLPLPALFLLPALAGCATHHDFAPPCPKIDILADAADLTRYHGQGRDLTDLVLEGRVTGIGGNCSWGENDTVQTRLSVELALSRGPAAPGRVANANWFVAVMRNGHVLDKQLYPIRADFPPNTDRMHLTSDPVTLNLPVTRDLSAAAYQVEVGFQLTPAELQYNRTHPLR